MENFVFPDEIKTKLMKMSKLRNIFTSRENEIHCKLYFLFTDVCFLAQRCYFLGVGLLICK